jgi:site-specific DNA-methyltransferase (adenine-specific)
LALSASEPDDPSRAAPGPVLPGLVTSPPVPNAGRKHVAQKPLPVMRELVRIVVPGGLVLDPFAGAGTTGLAALAEGRRLIGIEMHPAYAAIARRRLAAAERFREPGVAE